MPTIAELAKQFSARLVGHGTSQVKEFAPLKEANDQQLAFLANPLYRADAVASAAAGLVVSESDYEFLSQHESPPYRSYLVLLNLRLGFIQLQSLSLAQLLLKLHRLDHIAILPRMQKLAREVSFTHIFMWERVLQ